DEAEGWSTKLDRFICSQAIMLALAGVPGIYIHSLFGSPNDHAGFAKSGWKRDLNHQRLKLAAVESALSDPATREAQVFTRYARLIEVRRRQPAFNKRARQRVLEAGPGIFGLARGPREGQTLLTLHNVTASERVASGDWLVGGTAKDVISGRRFERTSTLQLAPYEVLWLQELPS
ncbi:MAG: sugar phosphorylase, partial [Candidatus Dormibacteraeota bacterium]|nr:sugar phosphorylase [Candidatus Dormibacteraeota bacterium]